MPDPAPEADVAETCEPPPEHDHHEWHWLRWKDDPPTMALWEGGRLRFVRGEASGNAALLYRLGWRYVGPALSATEIERLRAEVAELRASVVAFGAPWAASYAEQHGAPKGAFHHRHYDILAAAGARMDDFTRWVPDNER